MSRLKGLKDLVQEAIDQGASSIEEVHQAIAKKPLDVLQQIEPLEVAAKGVKAIQEKTIGDVYETIRLVNKTVGDIAGDMLEKLDPPEKE